MSKTILILFLSLFLLKVSGQDAANDSLLHRENVRFDHRSLIIPGVLIGYGVVGLTSPALKDLNNKIKNEWGKNSSRVRIDDYTQYGPALSVYALNAFGPHGRNNIKDRTIIMTTAYIIMWSSVSTIKNASKIERPDGADAKSFPSGHTANAFLGAEFLYQEYKDVSVWYGISGYVVATGTGFLRMTNNKHWLTDVSTGAGIGILSTKLAYWIHPFLRKAVFKDKNELNGLVMPYYNGRQYGLVLTMTL